MVATDGSAGAGRAVDVAAELAKATGGQLSIVTIEVPSATDEISWQARHEGDPGDVIEAISNAVLRTARDQARRIGARHVQTHAAWGDPAEALINFAKQGRIDTMVVGRRGRGQLAGLLLGSGSQKLVSLAPGTVIVGP